VIGEAGRRGSDVRSDCWVRVEPGGQGLRLSVASKVEAMYGPAIREQIMQAAMDWLDPPSDVADWTLF